MESTTSTTTEVTARIDSIPLMMGYACEPAAIQEVTCTTSSPKHDVSHSDATNDDPKRSEADQLMECDQQQQDTATDPSQLIMDTSVEPDSSFMSNSDDIESRIMQHMDRWSFDGHVGPVCFDYHSDFIRPESARHF